MDGVQPENSNSGDTILNYQESYAWQIGEKVYKLYDPAQEEIAIVEGKK